MAYKNPEEFAKVRTVLLAWRAAADAAKTAKSVEGKAHTAAKNELTNFLRNEGLPPSSAFSVPDGSFTYDVSSTNRIKPREWHALLLVGEITEEQYFAALTVGKADAGLIIGDDQVETISENVAGKDAKVRFTKSNNPVPDRAEITEIVPKRHAPVRPVVLPSNIGKQPLQTPAKPGLRKLTIKR